MKFINKQQQQFFRKISAIRLVAIAFLITFAFSGTLAMAREKPLDILFNMADTDQNGLISETEWHAAMQKRLEAIDTNHDGSISREEMEASKENFRDKMRSMR